MRVTLRDPRMRVTRRTPITRSSVAICPLIADWLYPVFAAAALNDPSVADRLERGEMPELDSLPTP